MQNHEASTSVKLAFPLQGAERKNKDETKSVERRMQKFMKQQPGNDIISSKRLDLCRSMVSVCNVSQNTLLSHLIHSYP